MDKDHGLISKKKIVIVGGGIAGLAAANKLVKSGQKDIVILEAKSRLGGRVHTTKKDSRPLELGAQWIHGENGNVLYALAKKNGFLFDFKGGDTNEIRSKYKKNDMIYFDDEPEFCLSDGSRIPTAIRRKVITKIEKRLDKVEENFRDEQFRNLLLREIENHNIMCQDNHIQVKANILKCFDEDLRCKQPSKEIKELLEKRDMSVAAFIKQELMNIFDSAKDTNQKEMMLGLLDWNMCLEKASSGCSLDEIPLSNSGEYYSCPGEENVELGKNGYQPVIDYFMKDIPESCIRLNSVVRKIDWSLVGIVEEEKSAYDHASFSKQVGTEAVSESILLEQKHLQSRSNLNSEKKGKVEVCLESGEIFVADYVLVTLPLGVLKHHCLKNTNEQFFVPMLPVKKLNAIDKLGFGTVDKIYLEFEFPFWRGDEFELQIIWKRGEIIELNCLKKWGRTSENTKWYRAIHGFEALLQHPNILCGWVSGSDAIEMEKEDEQFVMEVCRELLVRFSGLNEDKIGIPKSIIRTLWYHDPYSRGSYSYRSHGSSVESSLDLAQPLPSENNPRLLFAGEATHGIFYSTVHGAMITGFSQACTMLKNSKC